jgi:pimeloyl-ACP methyl ester carboxylesterase
MPALEVPGATITWDVAGDPAHAAVLFVHAGVATRAMWDPQFSDLAADHRVIRYDTRDGRRGIARRTDRDRRGPGGA